VPAPEGERLRSITTFNQLVKYLRDDLDWPIESDEFDDLTFEYEPEELGLDADTAVKIRKAYQLRPLHANQPWGIFFLDFEPKKLPVVVLRRILGALVKKKRHSANKADRKVWELNDLLFISAYGDSAHRNLTFAHFAESGEYGDLPVLRVLGWDDENTALHLDHAHRTLCEKLRWPDDGTPTDTWRKTWASAFTTRHGEVIATAKALAKRLAELAQQIRKRANAVLRMESERGPFRKLQAAFRATLIHDLSDDDFADAYAQTVSYGLLSARVSRPAGLVTDDVVQMVPVTNPFLEELLRSFLTIGGRNDRFDFDELGVSEVTEMLRQADMPAVLRDFDDKNPHEDPVIHFYEVFLTEYDADKRLQRGVFYTPRPVVSYIVHSVHELLQTELGLADGLADTATWGEVAERVPGLELPEGVNPTDRFVTILDPATGTGTFLIEAIEVIHNAMAEKWRNAGHRGKKADLWNEYVRAHLLPRLHGYELMMAPYAIAHMKIGLKLAATGYRFQSAERARVYLTNSLEPPQDLNYALFDAPALEHESRAVNAVKRRQRFTVVIGNPPYSGISANMSPTAQRIVDAYKIVDGESLNERKLWLQDDYVKFLRTAQTTIDQAGTGILGFITNHGYLDNPTFRGMRQSLMTTFRRIRVLDLHGNANKKERSPDGTGDSNVFDIRQGVAICLGTRTGSESVVEHADLWGDRETKYTWLADHAAADTDFARLSPDSPFYFFKPQTTDTRAEYEQGWKINEAMPVYCAGFITARDHFVVDFDEVALLTRIGDFANLKRSDAEIREAYFAGCGSKQYPDGDTRGWKVPEARTRVANDKKWRERVRTCLYRPFDIRSIYWADWMVDWPRPEVMRHTFSKQALAISVSRSVEIGRFEHVLCSRLPLGHHTVSLKEVNYLLPLYLLPDDETSQKSLTPAVEREPNFGRPFLKELSASLGVPQEEPHGLPRGLTPEDIFNYTYAVVHSPTYRSRYFEFLKSDFPRLPLPGSLDLFRALAKLGGALVALHLVEAPVQSAVSARYDKAAKTWRYAVTKDTELPVSLTFVGPEKPKVTKIGWNGETVWIDAVRSPRGTSGNVGFRGIPEEVWNFSIGGYQICDTLPRNYPPVACRGHRLAVSR
jgi:hypothetical protein